MTDDKPKRKPGRPKGSKDKKSTARRKRDNKILELKAKDVAVTDIAAAVKCNPTTVYETLKRFEGVFDALDKVEDYRQVKTHLLDATQYRMLEFMAKKENLEKASINNLAYAFQNLNNASRLEQGLSTANKASTVYIKAELSSPHDSQSAGKEPQAIDVTPESEEDS